ncbi:MAG TPA: hypothetical protein VFE02_09655, partial [Candidatus Acidoferrales bacterium]|nr:hypothetical protein [Candidatus Acidoferrales bacterium]
MPQNSKTRSKLSLIYNASGDNRRDGAAGEFAAIEWGIFGFAEGIFRMENPFLLGGEDREVA